MTESSKNWQGARPTPMTSARYAEAFATFLSLTTERERILEYIDYHPFSIYGGQNAKVLSVGTGPGELDFKIIGRVFEPTVKVDVVCVEPNPTHAEALTERFADGSVRWRGKVVQERFEDVALGDRHYDLILALHSLYYFRNRAAVLAKVTNALARNGRFIAFVNARVGLAHVQQRFLELTHGRRPTTLYVHHQLESQLKKMGYATHSNLIEAHVDFTRALTDKHVANNLFSFFIDGEFNTLPRSLRDEMQYSLECITVREGRRSLLYLYVGMIEAAPPALIDLADLRPGKF